ncbi:hypothetical protein COY16_06270 [Candidatus Roizmanbacteria bacterium CG_4_10_14_0_2_um_filter_39_13]|uniref:HTH arsR-type domain-containing protein n=1 Tax=Candidatus Roizmanbacteria bacterium CG_4_10_14_0_2_um_filter_39_13 TaxID=1974825 RepID=A0A2M7TV25_9BACT|nr:MAG: hypothetical protein COY16_06270 [Candidatus Roizmanbacteria bacterium CG_4_10_14_0_2_um_filter_39_13]
MINKDDDIEIVLSISPKSIRLLKLNNIYSINDLENIDKETTLKNIEGFGSKSFKELENEYQQVFNKPLFKSVKVKDRQLLIEDVLESEGLDKSKFQLNTLVKKKRKLNIKFVKKLIRVKRLYNQLKTLQLVANKLGISRERVRQLLNRGASYNLYKYQPTRLKVFEKLIEQISRERLIQEIEDDKTIHEICSLFEIEVYQYLKLLQFYKIESLDHRLDAKKRKYINKYMGIVDILGHHPSTTELNTKSDWRNTWHGIAWFWGSVEKFRRSYGIVISPMKIHPNTLKAWQQNLKSRKQIKQDKIKSILLLLKSAKMMHSKEIASTIGCCHASTSLYLKELFDTKLIKKNRFGRKIFFSLLS